MLSLSMGLRQSLGLSPYPPFLSISLLLQNLAWASLQPPPPPLRPIMVAGALMYVVGLVALAAANGLIAVIRRRILIGASLACTASALAMSVSARAVAPQLRSLVYGIVSAAGSIGAMIAAPIGQGLANGYGWRIGVIGFVALAVIMIPSAWFAGRADKVAEPPPMPGGVDERSAGQAFVAALKDARFVVVAIAFFVCGLQLVFLTTHLPSYLALCGMDPC